MPAAIEAAPQPLTALTEDEKMFQSSVRQFAREEIRPHVREMDEAGVFRKDLIRQFFDMGLMGIEIPEEFGGQGGTFFQAVLAVEELSAAAPADGDGEAVQLNRKVLLDLRDALRSFLTLLERK